MIPFGCDKRGGEEDGYLRLCGACQAIRRLPDTFFPPFINEVMCDDDKACLYFYDFRAFAFLLNLFRKRRALNRVFISTQLHRPDIIGPRFC